MRIVLQRVREARVRVEGEEIARIGRGLLAFVGVEKGDAERTAERLARKTAALRIHDDGVGKMARALAEVKGEALVVSQFTLAADLAKGNRPSFDSAEAPDRARALVEAFCATLRELGLPVREGRFGARMEVRLTNDGPATFVLDSGPAG